MTKVLTPSIMMMPLLAVQEEYSQVELTLGCADGTKTVKPGTVAFHVIAVARCHWQVPMHAASSCMKGRGEPAAPVRR